VSSERSFGREAPSGCEQMRIAVIDRQRDAACWKTGMEVAP
jgi:hypothetical protein